MKKLLIILIAVITALGICCFTACGGKYVPAKNDTPGTSSGGEQGGGKDPAPANGQFSVTLILDGTGEVFTQTDGVTAYWDDGVNKPASAEFNSGVAKTSGLDGDYRVTLSGLDSRYTYDPNGNTATNYAADITVKVYEVISVRTSGTNNGSDVYRAISLTRTGAYRVTLQRDSSSLFYIYKPQVAGMYAVRSLVNISDNNVNPIYRECTGTDVGMRYVRGDINGGGASSTFTVNFKYELGFNSDELNNVLIFGVKAATRESFPVTFDILLERTGDYVRFDYQADIVLPEEFNAPQNNLVSVQQFRAEKDALMKANGSTFTYLYRTNTARLLDGSMVRFNEETGYYHIYNKANRTFGAVLCAKISDRTEALESSFTEVEYIGNKALTIDDNYDYLYGNFNPDYKPKYSDRERHYLNYKVFIEGFAGIASHESAFPGITKQYSAYEGKYGYKDFVNSDGVYPVTKELQRFLQGYATTQMLFIDNTGWADGPTASPRIQSAEEDQWLFACGYYR